MAWKKTRTKQPGKETPLILIVLLDELRLTTKFPDNCYLWYGTDSCLTTCNEVREVRNAAQIHYSQADNMIKSFGIVRVAGSSRWASKCLNHLS